MKYIVKIQDREYEVQIDDIHTRPIRAIVNGETIDVSPKEDKQLAAMPSTSPGQISSTAASFPKSEKTAKPQGATRDSVNAPIPGVIIHIAVVPGDEVEFGQVLCTLEAMKMKNAIRSGQPGTIDKVLVSVGDQVSQNQPLMTYRREKV